MSSIVFGGRNFNPSYQSCMVVSFRFTDPYSKASCDQLTHELERKEGGYFKDMRIDTPDQGKMNAAKFVQYIKPWNKRERETYETTMCPHAAKAIDAILSTLVGRKVSVWGTISLVKLDYRIEKGFP
jgi:hypothetical protein